MTELSWLDTPVFLCGHPKSGTTLLTSLLDNHPQLLVIPEETKFYHRFLRFNKISDFEKFKGEDFFLKFIAQIEQYSDLYKFNKDKTEDSIGGNYDYTEIDYTTFCNHIKNFLSQVKLCNSSILKSFAYAMDKTINTTENSSTIKYWVEKTPYNGYYIDQISNDFPLAKYIHIIRDPRDNWVSYKKKRSVLRIDAYCRNWEKTAHIALQNSAIYPKKHMVLFYEDLVTNPADGIAKVATFLGIDNSPSLLEPTKFGKAWHGNSMWGNRDTQINQNAISRYKSWPNQHEIQYIESCLHPYFLKLNYKHIHPVLVSKRVSYTWFKIQRVLIDSIKHTFKITR